MLKFKNESDFLLSISFNVTVMLSASCIDRPNQR